jgi:hypothetical protein
MKPTGVRILDRSCLHNYPQPGSCLSCVTLTSLAHNKSVASRQIAPGASATPPVGTLPAGSRRQADGWGVVPNHPVINSRAGTGATGSVSITFRVVGEAV